MAPSTLVSLPELRTLEDYNSSGYNSDDAVADDPIGYPRAPATRPLSATSVLTTSRPRALAVPARRVTSKGPRPRRVSFGPVHVHIFSDPDYSEVFTPDPLNSRVTKALPSRPMSRRDREEILYQRALAAARSSALPVPPEPQFYQLTEEPGYAERTALTKSFNPFWDDPIPSNGCYWE